MRTGSSTLRFEVSGLLALDSGPSRKGSLCGLCDSGLLDSDLLDSQTLNFGLSGSWDSFTPSPVMVGFILCNTHHYPPDPSFLEQNEVAPSFYEASSQLLLFSVRSSFISWQGHLFPLEHFKMDFLIDQWPIPLFNPAGHLTIWGSFCDPVLSTHSDLFPLPGGKGGRGWHTIPLILFS